MITCNLEGQLTWAKETEAEPASVGKICAWGAHYVATISDEVPEGERDEYACKFAAVDDLYAALEESVKDLVAAQVNSRKAAKHDHNWEGVSEAIQPSVDRARAALEKARGES